MIINIPESVLTIIEKLVKNGFEAYVVGGCVRDSLLGVKPKDWDICTDALPRETIQCLDEYTVIPTGLKHGTVSAVFPDGRYEITTFRRDGAYSDRRHPDNVSFDAALKDDLARRDFTVNAMAYSPESGLVDFYCGSDDLNNGIINCVGNPDDRFSEDALRIMRALRFASLYGFDIGRAVKESILKNASLLNDISAERIRDELCGFLTGMRCRELMVEFASVFAVIIPGLHKAIGFDREDEKRSADIWEYTAGTVGAVPPDLTIRLAALLHKAAHAAHIMRTLKFDNRTIKAVSTLVLYHDTHIEAEIPSVLRLLNKTDKAGFLSLLELKRAIIQNKNAADITNMEHLEKIKRTADIIFTRKLCYRLSDLAADGKTLIAAGVPKGRDIGIILNDCLQKVMQGRLANTRADIIAYVKDRYPSLTQINNHNT
ncbi:MAG: polynucleotide adenylyltransferase [Eubacteriales bacterium]|nr:polynucleotide adenylyltransferase [Eubacteriales bacterium]